MDLTKWQNANMKFNCLCPSMCNIVVVVIMGGTANALSHEALSPFIQLLYSSNHLWVGRYLVLMHNRNVTLYSDNKFDCTCSFSLFLHDLVWSPWVEEFSPQRLVLKWMSMLYLTHYTVGFKHNSIVIRSRNYGNSSSFTLHAFVCKLNWILLQHRS